jgi:hypothetical protein
MLITLVGWVGNVPTVLTSRSELTTGAAKTEATKGRASRMEVNRIVLDDLLVGWWFVESCKSEVMNE